MTKSYIIKFKKNVINSDSLLPVLSFLYKFKFNKKFKDVFDGALIDIDDIQLEQLKNSEFIDIIEEDFNVTTSDVKVQSSALGLSDITKPTWYQTVTNLNLTATSYSSINCYVVDTGISVSHTEFNAGQVSLDYCSLKGIRSADDDNWHGTAVASIIGGKNIGIANNISLRAIKVLDSTGSGKVSDVITGLNWILKNKKPNAIINMSIEAPYSATLNSAVASCINAGIHVCCAAGNGNTNITSISPASTPGIYSIGAFDSSYTKASFSNYGSSLTSFMPGVNIYGAYKSATNIDYCNVNGTSFSSPMTAGFIAILLANNTGISTSGMKSLLDSKEVINLLSGVPSGTPNQFLKN